MIGNFESCGDGTSANNQLLPPLATLAPSIRRTRSGAVKMFVVLKGVELVTRRHAGSAAFVR